MPYNYSQNPSTVAGAATANNNMWDYRSNVQAMFTAIEDSSALTFEEIVEDPATGTVGDLRMAFSDGFAGDGADQRAPLPSHPLQTRRSPVISGGTTVTQIISIYLPGQKDSSVVCTR